MATKQELLDEAKGAGVEVDESMTKAAIQAALDAAAAPAEAVDPAVPTESAEPTPDSGVQTVTDAAGKEWEVPKDASAEELRGPLDGVAHDDGTEDVHVPLGTVLEDVAVEVGDENPHSPEVARGPLDATPAESIRHYNPGSGA